MVAAQFRAHLNGIKRKRVAQRNQLIGALGRLNAGKSRHVQNISFGKRILADAMCKLGGNHHARLGNCATSGHGFLANVNHGGAAARVHMSQHLVCGSTCIDFAANTPKLQCA